MTNRAINAGVDAQTGFALQRNTAIYVILEQYNEKFKDQNYFVYLEHHDDFLYCFLNENNHLKIVEAYQSKKKSSGKWTLNAEMTDIITKMLRTGKNLIGDNSMVKCDDYRHFLIFSSNQNIELKKGRRTILVKEDNIECDYTSLHEDIKEFIKNGITPNTLHDELQNIKFKFIELGRTTEKQEGLLIGTIVQKFGDSIQSPSAALATLIALFRNIEERYNNGNIASFLDPTKRISGREIDNAIEIITTKSKSYNYWRNRYPEICKTLKIRPIDKDSFKQDFESAFDLFKCNDSLEHQNILSFVRDNIANCTTFTEEENIGELIDEFLNINNTRLGELTIKAVFYAAYFEIKG